METETGSTVIELPNGNSIDFALNVGRVMYGKTNGIDLGDLENGPVTTMFLDPVKLGQAVWALYQDRLNDAGIASDAKLYELMDSQMTRTVEAAMKKAISDFFSWGQPFVRKIDQKLRTIETLMEVETPPSGPTSGEQLESLESTQPS